MELILDLTPVEKITSYTKLFTFTNVDEWELKGKLLRVKYSTFCKFDLPYRVLRIRGKIEYTVQDFVKCVELSNEVMHSVEVTYRGTYLTVEGAALYLSDGQIISLVKDTLTVRFFVVENLDKLVELIERCGLAYEHRVTVKKLLKDMGALDAVLALASDRVVYILARLTPDL